MTIQVSKWLDESLGEMKLTRQLKTRNKIWLNPAGPLETPSALIPAGASNSRPAHGGPITRFADPPPLPGSAWSRSSGGRCLALPVPRQHRDHAALPAGGTGGHRDCKTPHRNKVLRSKWLCIMGSVCEERDNKMFPLRELGWRFYRVPSLLNC